MTCPQCGGTVSERDETCPTCGNPVIRPVAESAATMRPRWRGFEWRTTAEILGWPLIHIAAGRDPATGKLLVAKGVIAIGQFGIGLITIAQFGIGILFGFGQFTGGVLAIGQFALGIYFGLGQFASGATAIGQFAVGKYVLAQIGFGEHVWAVNTKDPRAIEYFGNLWDSVRGFIGGFL